MRMTRLLPKLKHNLDDLFKSKSYENSILFSVIVFLIFQLFFHHILCVILQLAVIFYNHISYFLSSNHFIFSRFVVIIFSTAHFSLLICSFLKSLYSLCFYIFCHLLSSFFFFPSLIIILFVNSCFNLYYSNCTPHTCTHFSFLHVLNYCQPCHCVRFPSFIFYISANTLLSPVPMSCIYFYSLSYFHFIFWFKSNYFHSIS